MRNSHEGEILSRFPPIASPYARRCPPSFSSKPDSLSFGNARGINRSYSFTFSFHGLESDFCRGI